jgi:hypothetical protein
MSISIVHHVREKSQAKGSARTLLLNLAIYANDCCGVAWPADATLYHDVNVSRQRIHEVKNALERTGELVILARPGDTNLYFVAWAGAPLGGTSAEHPEDHDSRCPLRDPAQWDRCARLWPEHYPPRAGGGSEFSNPSVQPQGSDFSDRGGQNFLTQKLLKTREKNHAPAAPVAHAPDKAETASPFWCGDCGYAIPACVHRTAYRVQPRQGVTRPAPVWQSSSELPLRQRGMKPTPPESIPSKGCHSGRGRILAPNI